MGNKLPVLVLVIFVSIASMQMSFAEEEYVSFVGCGTYDNEFINNVGVVSASINNGGDLIISIYNAYPGYEAYVNFTLEHIGDDDAPQVNLTDIIIDNAYQGVEIEVKLTDLAGNPIPLFTTSLLPGEILEGLITTTVLSGADEEKSYSFNIELIFSD